jgi:hypothetical protein
VLNWRLDAIRFLIRFCLAGWFLRNKPTLLTLLLAVVASLSGICILIYLLGDSLIVVIAWGLQWLTALAAITLAVIGGLLGECGVLAWIPVSTPFQSTLPRNLRCGSDEATFAVNHDEVTVGDSDGSGIHSDKHIHPVMICPELFDLHITQVNRFAKGMDYLVSDAIIQGLALVVFRLFFNWFLDLEIVRHRRPPRLLNGFLALN